jgi:hypothetical protein
MSAELLAELTRRGVTLTAAGGRLQVAAPRGAITAELRQQVGVQKAQGEVMLRSALGLAASVALWVGEGRLTKDEFHRLESR